MGELHLEVLVDRLQREFRVEAHIGKPQVAYRESITKEVKEETRYIKQTGGKGQYAHILMTVAPGIPGSGLVFENQVVGGRIPREYISSIHQGLKESMRNGVLGGYQLEDLEVTLLDGSHHEVDSSEMAFKIAASKGLKDAIRKAGPVLMEPMMQIEVVTPEEYIGDVIGDITSRRGKVKNIRNRGEAQVIEGEVPLAGMFGYATDLRSMTQGRAIYSMQFDHYKQVPKSIQEEIINQTAGVGF